MKKMLILLLSAALVRDLPAQIQQFPNPRPASQSIFDNPAPGMLRSKFDFILPNNNRMMIEVYNIDDLRSLPNLDSLFRKIWEDLQPLRDSLADPLNVRRVDYVTTANDTKIRIKQHTPAGTYFSYKDDELVQMKVDQDTIRYKGIVPLPQLMQSQLFFRSPYVVTLMINNVSDLPRLGPGILQSALSLLMTDINPHIDRPAKKRINASYYALYNVQQQKRISPYNLKHFGFYKVHGLQPYVQVGIQYVRGAWAPSAGAGLEYYYNHTKSGKYAMRLFWEPYFFFRRDANDKLVTERNDFITLKFCNNSKISFGKDTPIEFNENFSFSYLVSRKGDWFNPTTFKFTIPGIQMKNVLLEPEFFFNKLLKNFSPSAKLVVFIE
ncbi:MAG: hypothetical protein ABW019_06530 [Chitinophagaceae bacterium]